MVRYRIVRRISLDSMMTALYAVLAYVTVYIGNIHITFASLPVVLSALVFGTGDSVAVALLGEFINQILLYGIGPTTAVWIIPPMLRGLVIGLFAHYFRRRGDKLESHMLFYVVALAAGSLLVSAGNTLALYLDSLIMSYPLSLVLIETVGRFFSSILVAFIIGWVCLPLAGAVRKQNLTVAYHKL